MELNLYEYILNSIIQSKSTLQIYKVSIVYNINVLFPFTINALIDCSCIKLNITK